jgi:hypothetical protein
MIQDHRQRPFSRQSVTERPIVLPHVMAKEHVMAPILYRCPITSQREQNFVAKEILDDEYVQITCTACRRVHYVNPKSGRVLGRGYVG